MGSINFEIEDEKKEQISAYVERNREYNSISHFFRLAGLKEMESDEESDPEIAPEVSNRLERIENELDGIQEAVEGLGAQIDDDDSEIEKLAQSVYQTIPRAPAPSSAEVVASGRPMDEIETQHAFTAIETDRPSTAEQLAKELEEDRKDILNAIQFLKGTCLPRGLNSRHRVSP